VGSDILIAAISSAPLLLGKAGLLDHKQYACGVFEEMFAFLDFMPKQNLVRTPVHRDGNLVTAIGFAYREFATEVIRVLGYKCDDTILDGVTKEYSTDDLTFFMGEQGFAEFLAQYQKELAQFQKESAALTSVAPELTHSPLPFQLENSGKA